MTRFEAELEKLAKAASDKAARDAVVTLHELTREVRTGLGAIRNLVSAAEEGSRAIDRTPDSASVILYTAGAGIALMAVCTVGYMYRRVRDLDWDFQHDAAAAHHDGH